MSRYADTDRSEVRPGIHHSVHQIHEENRLCMYVCNASHTCPKPFCICSLVHINFLSKQHTVCTVHMAIKCLAFLNLFFSSFFHMVNNQINKLQTSNTSASRSLIYSLIFSICCVYKVQVILIAIYHGWQRGNLVHVHPGTEQFRKAHCKC